MRADPGVMYNPERYIYLITGINPANYPRNRQRTWMWWSELETAQKAVKENWSDLYEGEYEYVVIEKYPEGHSCGIAALDGQTEWWYKWEGTWDDGHYESIEKPEMFENTIGFGM